MELFTKVAEETKIFEKLNAMASGEKINITENRSVLHVALRKPKEDSLVVGDTDVVKDVNEVLDRIQKFSTAVRDGTFKGHSGKKLKNIVAIGIGGSFLGPDFVSEALKHDAACNEASKGMNIRFLANVDPTDFYRATDGLDVEETLYVIVSKTFTTAETMLNARTCRNHILAHYKKANPDAQEAAVLAQHLCAVSTNLKSTKEFGIMDENVFGFWEWVGGRFSVSSAVGVLPLSLLFGFENVQQFLAGMNNVDKHLVAETDVAKNLPVLMGLIGVYNTYVAGFNSRSILPYSQALIRFAAHIQQLDMESNGKSVSKGGVRLPAGVETGPIIMGEPGTNSQHSFFQLMHQGRVIPAEFIGFTKSQTPIDLEGEVVSNHQELMSNFFAQPDALAMGKDYDTLKAEGVPEHLHAHKLFPGDRPSLSLLFKGSLTAYNCGQLLALYEHRVAVEGFLYDICSFDQWGVELGKVLAKDVRKVLSSVHDGSTTKESAVPENKFNESTSFLLKTFVEDM
uniref:Glucose-6-phosphate isomerase n=1 Tax=Strombidium inclinatum TaxID=197538 RepID=A0A7S3MTH2_9SPIT